MVMESAVMCSPRAVVSSAIIFNSPHMPNSLGTEYLHYMDSIRFLLHLHLDNCPLTVRLIGHAEVKWLWKEPPPPAQQLSPEP